MLGRLAPEHRLRDELAAHQAEYVAVAGVAAGNPDVLLAGNAADDREEIHHQAEQTGPVGAVEEPLREPLRGDHLARVGTISPSSCPSRPLG
jgi:hypothetical protein